MAAIRTIKGEQTMVHIVADGPGGIAISIKEEKAVVSSSELLRALSECIRNQIEGRYGDAIKK